MNIISQGSKRRAEGIPPYLTIKIILNDDVNIKKVHYANANATLQLTKI